MQKNIKASIIVCLPNKLHIRDKAFEKFWSILHHVFDVSFWYVILYFHIV